MSTLRWFVAIYPGWCKECGVSFLPGDEIAASENYYVGHKCCKGEGKDPNKTVMPTGKTKEDRCGDCFMIHSNGQEECE